MNNKVATASIIVEKVIVKFVVTKLKSIAYKHTANMDITVCDTQRGKYVKLKVVIPTSSCNSSHACINEMNTYLIRMSKVNRKKINE